MDRSRIEVAGVVAAVLLCVAFVASFAFGVLRGRPAGPVTGPAAYEAEEQSPATARVEVLNGSGRSGLARRATDHLRARGFDVVYFGNAPTAVDTTVVLDRVGRLDLARDVVKALGAGVARTEMDSTRYLDATVILGPDWPPDQEREREQETAADWKTTLKRWVTPG